LHDLLGLLFVKMGQDRGKQLFAGSGIFRGGCVRLRLAGRASRV